MGWLANFLAKITNRPIHCPLGITNGGAFTYGFRGEMADLMDTGSYEVEPSFLIAIVEVLEASFPMAEKGLCNYKIFSSDAMLAHNLESSDKLTVILEVFVGQYIVEESRTEAERMELDVL